jgi:hypothetical protein
LRLPVPEINRKEKKKKNQKISRLDRQNFENKKGNKKLFNKEPSVSAALKMG